VLLPIEDTMPMPVTTTRLILSPPLCPHADPIGKA